ncbi:2Fe-2S iron-sulfur cluster-binding protein [Zunongwangia sp. F363]|uniref:2Fe-2S iron-sulfur cluster-binding protein n=1 Tax=Autumnicola tepida TaxID=3075595 RepID=A0ABU3C8K8_9FLAO|nr:2Fe-2S iron-sulfur cluster-binding protein [Zunongwangia sp. F363]MDT0642675.1 2Fe-2S iron-sulfur cluster-binding protein [Zunongwangia sp. F363]
MKKEEIERKQEDLWPEEKSLIEAKISRRKFISRAILAAGGMAIAPYATLAAEAIDAPALPFEKFVEIETSINGRQMKMKLDPRTSLLNLLREQLSLTGTKLGCNQGACGACTVFIGKERINSCLTLAAQIDGQEVTTIEGIGSEEDFHPMQAAFIEHDGFQCGYCTSGQIMSAIKVVENNRAGSDDEIQEWMSGNICRCGAYKGIVAAIKTVRDGNYDKSLLKKM